MISDHSTRKVATILLSLLIISISSGQASAHSINVDVTSQTIEIEAYYGDGKELKNANVTVYKSNGEIFTTGKTDDNGKFRFDVNDVDSDYLTIEVVQLGHRDEVVVKLGASAKSDSETEFPLYQRALAGLGYLLGLAGLASLYLARRINRQKPEQSSGSRKTNRVEKEKNVEKTK